MIAGQPHINASSVVRPKVSERLIVTQQSAARYNLGNSWCGTLPRNTARIFRRFASASSDALEGPSPATTSTASTEPPSPPSWARSAGKIRSVPFSPESRWTISTTLVLSSVTPNRFERTSRRSFGSSGCDVNTSCVPDGTRRNRSSYSLPKWSRAKQSVGAEFNVPQRMAGHLPMRLYMNMPKLQTGAKGTCSCANIAISTWCEQYTGIRRQEQTDSTKPPIKDG
mmetsp:Transcript_100966/g.308749  ORF Transcript_100966/g.308749 Transcript_100966/m.308749 type:complete len:226 (+) Transcript_100966:487-1164(+)